MDDKEYVEGIRGRYGQPGLSDRLFEALTSRGVAPGALNRDHFRTFDEFHLQARYATRRLADMAGISPDSITLDLGCGVGGAARTLAAEYGAEVLGLDLSPTYVQAAQALTASVGLGSRVRFLIGDMRKLPFREGHFETAWIQHALLNVPDKAATFGEIRRVLRPEGRLAMYEILSLRPRNGPYPLPWADDEMIDHVPSPDVLRALLEHAGLQELAWVDLTAEIVDWGARALGPRRAEGAAPLGVDLIIGADFRERTANLFHALRSSELQVVMAVYQAE